MKRRWQLAMLAATVGAFVVAARRTPPSTFSARVLQFEGGFGRMEIVNRSDSSIDCAVAGGGLFKISLRPDERQELSFQTSSGPLIMISTRRPLSEYERLVSEVLGISMVGSERGLEWVVLSVGGPTRHEWVNSTLDRP